MKKISNPPNPFESTQREFLEPAPDTHLEIYEDTSRTILSKNDSRDGALNDSRFGRRMTGTGTYWKSISDLFRVSQKKYGLNNFPHAPTPSTFQVPSPQLEWQF